MSKKRKPPVDLAHFDGKVSTFTIYTSPNLSPGAADRWDQLEANMSAEDDDDERTGACPACDTPIFVRFSDIDADAFRGPCPACGERILVFTA